MDRTAASGNGATSVEALLADLLEARREFLDALGDVDPALLTTPGLVGEWSARELIAHMGYWTGHATEAIHHVEQGRGPDFEVGEGEVDARNATVSRVARATDLATVRQREEASFEALVKRLRRIDPSLLAARLADWGTLADGIREDGPEHYREHTADLRAWFGSAHEAADEEDAEDEGAGAEADGAEAAGAEAADADSAHGDSSARGSPGT